MDVILVGFIGGYIYAGFRSGFLRRLLGIVFMVISFVVSAYFRVPVGIIATTFFKGIPSDYANLVGYTIAFPVILVALHLGYRLVMGKTQPRGLVTESTDKLLGAILGGVEAVLILSAGIVILDAYFGTASSLGAEFHAGPLKDLTQQVNASETVKLLRATTVPFVLAILGPLLPKDINTLLPTGIPGRLPFPTP
ncbi:MAG: CvpA family protein [Candidatus Limnocylindrales bacterium]